MLKDAETDEVLGKMKVSALLEALPKVGKVKATIQSMLNRGLKERKSIFW